MNTKTKQIESLVLQAASGGCVMGASGAGVILAPTNFQLVGAIGIFIGLIMMSIAWTGSRKQAVGE